MKKKISEITFVKTLVRLSRTALPYILIIYLAFLFFSDDSIPPIDKNPMTNIKDAVVHAYDPDTGNESVKMYGEKLLRDAISNAITIYDCTAEVFSTNETSIITSNMANLDGTGNNATFKGDVVVFKEPATYLYTSELFYNIKKANIHTPQKVKIVEPDKITTGVGLDSNLKLKKIRLLDKVKVIMKDKEE